jgi:hypothetical protein
VANGYAALSDLEFADLIRVSDVGLLLYQGGDPGHAHEPEFA